MHPRPIRRALALATALASLSHPLVARASAGDNTREFGTWDEFFRLGRFKLERFELVQAGRERGCQLALPDQLRDKLVAVHTDLGGRYTWVLFANQKI